MAVPPIVQPLPASSGSSSTHESLALKIMPQDLQPAPYPACADCPASVWFNTIRSLRCYCTVMRAMVWDGEEQPVMNCDAREAAIVKMLADEMKL